jgi:phenylacetic acid degradation operon negative regulatory protein
VSASPSEPGPSPEPPPRALIVTLYGLYAREEEGWLSVGALIRLLDEVGVDEPAVRSSISRLKRRGMLEPQRVDGRAGYRLSDRARQILDAGDRRIFGRKRASLGEGWVLAVFSVPESERQKRHALRSRLAWLGFGTVGPGVWIAPGHLEAETRDMLASEGLDAYVDLFHADYLGFRGVQEEAASWWDLAALDVLYRQFVGTFQPSLSRWRDGVGGDGADGADGEDGADREGQEGRAFADYVQALTVWRRLPYLDPGLAPELLPAQWSGTRAADLFFELRHRLEGPAHRFVDRVRAG